MTKSYYVILGVEPDATQEEIRAAYRRQAKQVHPDHVGGSSEPFQTVQEAYEVLCDGPRRRVYDEQLARERRIRQSGRGAGPEPLGRRRVVAEPLVPTEGEPLAEDRWYGMRRHSLFDALLVRLWGEPDEGAQSRAASGTTYHVDVSLTWGQARRGGRIRVWIPVQVQCPTCRGTGDSWLYICRQCSGRGAIAGEYPVDLTYPGGMLHGSSERVSLGPLGMPDRSVVLHFHVQDL